VFEEFADGSIVWKVCVFGMADAETKLQELARESTNKFFAICLQDGDQHLVAHLLKSRAAKTGSF
jgi:hypothetical protein